MNILDLPVPWLPIADAVVKEIEAAGGKALAVAGDVSKFDTGAQIVAAVPLAALNQISTDSTGRTLTIEVKLADHTAINVATAIARDVFPGASALSMTRARTPSLARKRASTRPAASWPAVSVESPVLGATSPVVSL